MKRIRSLLAVLLVGCGGASDVADGPITITYYRWADPSEVEATRTALAAFEAAHPDIRVQFEYGAFGGYASKLQTLIAGRKAPDVFAVSGAWFHDLRAAGALERLDDRVAADDAIDLDAFYAAPVEVVRTPEGLFGLPRDFNVVALFYNRAHFREAGIAEPTADWGWTDLRDAARALTVDADGDGSPEQWGFQVSNDMETSWGNFVYQNGGRILDATRSEFRLDEPEAIEAIEFLRGLIHDDRVSPSPLDMESLSGTPFRGGRIAMISSGSWTLANLDATEGFEYGVAPLPRGRERAAIANGVAHAMSSSSRHKDAAWALMAFLSGAEGQRLLAASGTSIPARRDVAESPDFLEAGRPDVDRSVFLAEMAHARPLPFTRNLARWGGEVLTALDRVWLGEATPADAMSTVAPSVDRILSRHATP